MIRNSLLPIVAFAVLALLPQAVALAGASSLTPLATRILIYGIAAASLNLALGHGGMVSFGQAAFFGIGGYAVGILGMQAAAHEPLFGFIPGTEQMLVTLPVAMLASGIVAAAMGALSLRTGGAQFIMITLAFAQMIFFIFVSLKVYGGEDGIIINRTNSVAGLNMRDRVTLYYVTLAITALFFAGLARVTRSSFGHIVAGLRQNERRMTALGVTAFRYKLAALTLSGMGTGLAGALMANSLRFASPDMMSWGKSGELMVMVVLGGTGTLWGPLIGAAVLLGLESGLAAWTENWPMGEGLVLLLVVLAAPGGISSLVTRLTGRTS